MDILSLFKIKKQCHHEKVSPCEDLAYCPDCGELIENRWYITRCACCGLKLKAVLKNDEIVPEENFCHNCGSHEFEPEQVSKINCIDINYAVLVRTVIEPYVEDITQSWTNVQHSANYKLLTHT